jgi:hypothetical protein
LESDSKLPAIPATPGISSSSIVDGPMVAQRKTSEVI